MSISTPTAGELKHRVTIYRRMDHPVNGHEVVSIDSKICSVFCKIEPMGSMYCNGSQIENKSTHRFWFRTVKGLTDVLGLSRGILIKENNISFIPVRVTDCNGDGFFTLVEAREMGELKAESVNSVNMAGIANG